MTDQAGLSAPERMANLRGALVAWPGSARLFDGRRVVLVDDLLTTGASLVEAARAMRAEHDRAMRSGEVRRHPRTGGPGEAPSVAAVLAVRG
ncbi:ComF family protein [Streptomyces sulphureus]|uniref:ComF family protein n=1 Tax=Streptomyces sulphureus TaxID=47758 RepID=UPI001FE0C76D|nr:phosphoribosyltransferase family protein [Streptomyces sulphureus]